MALLRLTVIHSPAKNGSAGVKVMVPPLTTVVPEAGPDQRPNTRKLMPVTLAGSIGSLKWTSMMVLAPASMRWDWGYTEVTTGGAATSGLAMASTHAAAINRARTLIRLLSPSEGRKTPKAPHGPAENSAKHAGRGCEPRR